MTPAEYCYQNGYGIGTRLVGDEGYGPTVIEITAIGEEKVLAKTISHNHPYAATVSRDDLIKIHAFITRKK